MSCVGRMDNKELKEYTKFVSSNLPKSPQGSSQVASALSQLVVEIKIPTKHCTISEPQNPLNNNFYAPKNLKFGNVRLGLIHAAAGAMLVLDFFLSESS